jgi:type I restriction enzyme S subunit
MSWKNVKLGSVLKQYRIEHWVQNDKVYKQVSILNDGSVVLRGEKIGKEIGRKRQFVIDTDKYPKTLIFTRQLLLQGSIGIASSDVNGCIVTENMPMFSIEGIEIDFLTFFIKTELFKSQVRNLETSGTAQKSLHERQFLDLEIPLPTLKEQEKIIALCKLGKNNFEKINEEISQQRTHLQQLRQAILQEAVQGKLTQQNKDDEPADKLLQRIKAEKQKLIAAGKLKKEKELSPITKDEIPFELPKGWVWCRLENTSINIHYGFNASANSSKTEVKLLRITDIQDNKVNWEQVPGCIISEREFKTYSLDENDILIARTGGTIGKSYIVEDLSVSAVFASYLMRHI